MSKFKRSTQILIAVAVAIAGLLQNPAIENFVVKLVGAHPHLALAAGAIANIWALLHNPQVQQALGIELPGPADQKQNP